MAISKRQAIYNELKSRIDAIEAGDDYTTTPEVFASLAKAHDSDATVAVSIDYGSEIPDVERWTIGAHGGGPVALELIVNILVRDDGTDLDTLASSALQDVRNAVMEDLGQWQPDTGGVFSAYGECETDTGVLSFIGKTLYTQPVVFKYMAGPTW